MGSTCILKRNLLVTYTPLTIWTTVSQDLLSRSVGFERCLNDWWSLQPLYPYLYRSPGLPSSSTFSWRPQNGPCTIQNPVWGEDISVKQVTEMYYAFLFINALYHLFFLFWIKYNIRFYGQTNVLKVGKQHTGLLGFKLRLLTVSNIEVSGPYLAVFWLYPPRNK